MFHHKVRLSSKQWRELSEFRDRHQKQQRGVSFDGIDWVKACLVCNERFRTHSVQRKYCSKECQEIGHNQNIHYQEWVKSKTFAEWKQCGQEFLLSNRKKHYCSDACRKKSHRALKKITHQLCQVCDKDISAKRLGTKYCSSKCRNKAFRKTTKQSKVVI